MRHWIQVDALFVVSTFASPFLWVPAVFPLEDLCGSCNTKALSLQAGATIGLVGYVLGTLAISQGVGSRFRRRWLFPATLSAGFLAFTLYTISKEGPYGFWTEHIRNLWGNQVWFDLVLAGGLGYAALVPRARAVGMDPFLWLLLIFPSGCIGLYAMYARVLQLEQSQKREQ